MFRSQVSSGVVRKTPIFVVVLPSTCQEPCIPAAHCTQIVQGHHLHGAQGLGLTNRLDDGWVGRGVCRAGGGKQRSEWGRAWSINTLHMKTAKYSIRMASSVGKALHLNVGALKSLVHCCVLRNRLIPVYYCRHLQLRIVQARNESKIQPVVFAIDGDV